MFNKVNLNLSYNMKYLIPKKIQPSDLEILESNTTFKIKNINNPIHLFGIPLLLKNVTIIKYDRINRFYIILSNEDYKTINTFNSFLSDIENYKDIIEIREINKENKSVLIIYPNSVIEKYYSQRLTSFYINIKFVKKSGFFSYPVLNIL